MKLAEKILGLRKARGMSQEELAAALDVSRQAVSRWESGSALPDASNVLQLSRLFGITADYLLDDTYGSAPAARSTPQAETTEEGEPAAPQKERWWTSRRIAGVCLSAVGVFINFGIYVASRFVDVMIPWITYENDGTKMYHWDSTFVGVSFRYFIEAYQLQFLVLVGVVLLIVGIDLIRGGYLTKRCWKKFLKKTEH